MKVFFDSSALAKRYIREKGSEKIETILKRASSLGLSSLCPVEIISALCRRRRELALTKDQYLLSKQALIDDARDAEIVNVVPRVVGKAIVILEEANLSGRDEINGASAVLPSSAAPCDVRLVRLGRVSSGRLASAPFISSRILRTIDAIHIASAIEWKADVFVSSDRRQLAAAVAAGLKIESV